MRNKYILAFGLIVGLFFGFRCAATPPKLTQFGYFDVYYNDSRNEVNYISEVSDFSNFFYLDPANVLSETLGDNERQQKITSIFSQARSRGLKIVINAKYYFLENDPSFKARTGYRLACPDPSPQVSPICQRWQADKDLLKSLQADILAFLISDRPNFNLVSKSDQKAIADRLHAAVPGVPVMANYVLDGRLNSDKKCVVTTAYDDVPPMWYYGTNREDCVASDSNYGIPDNIDWLSVQAFNLGHKDLVAKYWIDPIKQIVSAFPNKPVLPIVESFSDHLNHYGATMDDVKTFGFSKRRADGESIGWYYDAAKTNLSGYNVMGFLYYSYGGLNLGQPARGDGSVLTKQKEIFAAQSVLPIIKSFNADPAVVNPNTSTVFNWEVSGASQVSIDNGVGVVRGANAVATLGESSTVFTLTATNSYGSVNRSILVSVVGSKTTAPPTPEVSAAFKDGSLVNNSGTIYVIENSLKRPVASMRVFSGFGYKLGNVLKANLSEVKSGEPLLHENQKHPRGALVMSGGTVFFMGANLRYPFTSAEIFSSWGCQFKDVVGANNYDLRVPIGPPVDKKK